MKALLALVVCLLYVIPVWGATQEGVRKVETIVAYWVFTCGQNDDTQVCTNSDGAQAARPVGKYSQEITCTMSGVTVAEAAIDLDLQGSVDGTNFKIIVEDMDSNDTWTDKTKGFESIRMYSNTGDTGGDVTIACKIFGYE